MAEKSYLWTTGGAGDGSATYTRADWARVFQIVAACHDDIGIAPSYLNGFAGSVPAANQFQVGTGAAIVDGRPYDNDSAVTLTGIPSAVGGGNTRIDRVVLRCSWSAQTVRITRIAGTDAASPTAPALTQTPGTTYDLPLFQIRITTAGVVTIQADERVFAMAQTAGLADSSVTTAKLAASAVTAAKVAAAQLDDSHVASQIFGATQRQGGGASRFSTSGTTTYTVGKLRVVFGVASITVGGSTVSGAVGGTWYQSAVTVTWPTAFSEHPIVLATPMNNHEGGITADFSFVRTFVNSTTSAQITAFSGTLSAQVIRVAWLAIGPA